MLWIKMSWVASGGEGVAGVASEARMGRGGLLMRIGRGGFKSSSRPERPYSLIPGTPGDMSRGPRREKLLDRSSSSLGAGRRVSGMAGVA